MMHIAIIGAGYIGSAAASFWTQKGHHVTVTTRDPLRLDQLSKCSQKCVLVEGSDEDGLAPLIQQNDLIVVTIAADSRSDYEEAYLKTAHTFKRIAAKHSIIKRLIYTSSTSVYGDHQGLWVNEESELKAKSDQGKILIETEAVFHSLAELGWHVCILRLAEIYGPGREISRILRSLKGTPLPGTGETFTNMIHQTDITQALDFSCRHNLSGIYNLADDEHMSRKELYDMVSRIKHLPIIPWNPRLGSEGPNKRVSNIRIKGAGLTLTRPLRDLS